MSDEIRFEYGVFPYASVKGTTVKWNSVIHYYEGDHRKKVIVLPASNSVEQATARAMHWINQRKR